jgi:predicted naringenin-chalcone synthase/acyl-CoA synthetase (AMP-forming)/AMP-acid ligase II/uncharacterized protein YkuJ
MFNDNTKFLFKSAVREEDIAFLQYTSGSTGLAKGVIVHHRTLGCNAFNCALLTQGIGNPDTYQWSLGISWLPTFHDMGLIGFHVTPILIGGTMLYQSPIHFIQNPVAWLKMISRCNEVFTGAPPFALDLLCKRTTDEEMKTLNLGAIGSLILGAEPIRASYMESFSRKFKAVGFDPRKYVTCFGMAENVLHVTGKWGVWYGTSKILVSSKSLRSSKLIVYKQDRVDRIPDDESTVVETPFVSHFPVKDSTSSVFHQPILDDQNGIEDESQWLVSSGELIPWRSRQILGREYVEYQRNGDLRPHYCRREHGSYVTIVDPNTQRELPDGHIGEVWILSASKTAGYWNRPELSQEQFHAKLASTCKQDTKELIEWVTTKLPRLYNGIDIKGNLDPSVLGRTIQESLDDELPHSALLTNALNTTTLDPVTHTLRFNHKNTPLDQIKAEWLRTGDMGVIHGNEIYITGRIKDMIILRGQNFYADDIEHSFSTDTNDLAKVNTSNLDRKSTAASNLMNTGNSNKSLVNSRPAALNFIRPGHAIAYSIELTPKRHNDLQSDPVVKAGVEGEHLCLLVELSSDGMAKLLASAEQNGGDEAVAAVLLAEQEKSKTQKNGIQAPLWQRVLNNYATAIVGGMSQLNSGDLDVQQQSLQQPRTCNERMMLYTRQILFNCVRMGLNASEYVSSYIYPNEQVQQSNRNDNTSNKKNGQNNKNEDDEDDEDFVKPITATEFSEERRYLDSDYETTQLKALYPQTKLNTIAAAIRRVVSTKFMLIVDKIVFISPRTIQKTSSGKKRRNDTVYGVEHGYYDHRIIGYSYSKAMQTYTTLMQRDGLRHNVRTNQDLSKLSSNAKLAAVRGGTPKSTPTIDFSDDGDKNKTFTAKLQPTIELDEQTHFAGTVGVSLYKKGDAYSTAQQQPISLISKSNGVMDRGTLDKADFLAQNIKNDDKKNDNKKINTKTTTTTTTAFSPTRLLPNYTTYTKQFEHQDRIHASVKASRDLAASTTFEALKSRVLGIICKEINAIHNTSDSIADEEKITFGDSGETVLTVEYLQKVSTFEAEKQSELFDEFGMDSITGFKLAKVFSDEFSLPQATLGPHLFLNDSSINGVINVLFGLIKTNAIKLTSEYEKTYNIEFTDDFKPSTNITPINTMMNDATTKPTGTISGVQTHTDYDKHDKTAAYVFRGSTNNNRIPYILGIGTATPHIGAPQELVIEAMLEPMKMDDKSNDRFRKIGSHSGVGTRYSVLDNLGQIFWGKEGVNSGNDEFIDIRQQVYKREAVKLSIQSAADAVRDWLGDKVYLTEAQRDAERMEKYKECQKLHNQYEDFAQKAANAGKKNGKKKVVGDKSDEKINPTLKSSDQKTASPIETELKLQASCKEKLKSVKSFAEGDSHIVETTSGNKAEDEKILKLGSQITTKLNRTITHIVAITCTGVIVPGLEFHIMKALGLPETTQRLPITFAGCFGAISGLRTASALANENPLHRVLVVCTELCTLHMQLSDKIDNLVGSALFADGSGAFVVGCAPTDEEVPIFSIDSLSSYVIPNTVQQMAWEATKSGQVIGLAKEIASEIFNVIGDVVDDMLQYTPDPKNKKHRIAAVDCNLAIHPGGPLIINTIQGGFGLPSIDDSSVVPYSHPVAETWKILHEYGNMSSATLVYVLDRLRLQQEKNNKPTPTLAFGPGLSIECSLLYRLEGNPGDKKNAGKK